MRVVMLNFIKYNFVRKFFRYMEKYDITLEELKQKQLDGAEVIDVRNKREYEEGHIEGSINVPEYEINEDFKNIVMRMGMVYDGVNKKIHVLLTDFATNSLVYVRTISSLDTKWFSVNEDGSVKFGLYADTAFTATFNFFDYEFSKDKDVIEEKFPAIKEA